MGGIGIIEKPAPGSLSQAELSRYIDHTKLTFSDGENDQQAIQALCQQAKEYNFYAVCVRPQHVALAKSHLTGTPIKVATVIGFPQTQVSLEKERVAPTVGNIPLIEKLQEVAQALQNGVDELDVVLNVPLFKQEPKGNLKDLQSFHELVSLVQAAQGKPVKVIIETDLLSDEESRHATCLCALAGAAMVKTSTGMIRGGQGATAHGIEIIRNTLASIGQPLGIKASGGIKTLEKAQKMIQLGATRLGTSSGVSLLGELLTR